ncbi:MAG: hypothetical protein ACI9PN_002654, partial [Candidatus Azotimanducaceae bacterium]
MGSTDQVIYLIDVVLRCNDVGNNQCVKTAQRWYPEIKFGI